MGVFVTSLNNSRNLISQRLSSMSSCRISSAITSSIESRSRCNFSSSSSTDDHYSLFESSSFQHWFKNWKDVRKHKLTASTFAGAIGFWSHRRAQLWSEKLGAIEQFRANLATCWSNAKEVEAIERYELITGHTVLFPQFQVYGKQQYDWLGASPDGLIDGMVYGLPSLGFLEIKCPLFDGDVSNAKPWSRVPHYCIPQAQGLMEIMDRDWMDVYVWTPRGSNLFRLRRDAEYWEVMKMALSDFWWNHVQPAKELCGKYDITKPLIELKSLRPSPRHESCSYLVWKSKHLVDNSELLVRELNGKLQQPYLMPAST